MISLYAFMGALEQGFAFGLMVLGVYLTFRVLDFPDLTVDGSLPLGAAVSAVAITNGYHPFLAMGMAVCAGFIAGAVTGILNTKFKILHLLASILTMISLYSINIRIMGRPNITLLGQDTLIDKFMEMTGLAPYISTPILFAIISITGLIAFIWFLKTSFGLAMLATGDNPKMITSLGVNRDMMIIFGVGLSNGMVALSGALVAQNQGSADVNMGIGTIIAGLASVIIGETIFGTKTITCAMISAVLGSVLYRIAIALALGMRFGDFAFTPSDLNLVTAVLVIAALVSPQIKANVLGRRLRA
ncbi:putative ABC transport system permease protein [Maridesulfovibrio ferrireducens]|uniref:Putative ABC transport system permease protein n=1 Tax=Maridesulfovibrio ferrireducens TaxID=246191 RepID=A0A1G9HNK4_9BACT|nr:ABC transporter permease [Maridesulfovibrio ferrireducens]SDL14376.1 putative ABC transport system permease protein [Maridesulfovibrio ferrireducens]